MKTLKISLIILCLLHVSAPGLPQSGGGTFLYVWQRIKVQLANHGNDTLPGKDQGEPVRD